MLLSHGHPHAGLYTIGQIHDEAELVRQRINGELVTMAVLNQAAIASVLSQEAGKSFRQLVERMSEE